MNKRQAAISRSQIAQQARPLGDLIIKIAKLKREGVDDPWQYIKPPIPKPKKKKRKSLETQIVRECLRLLYELGIFAYRQNTRVLYVDGRPIQFGYPGSGDIGGLLPDGRRLEIECKSPTGKQTAAQKTFQQKIESNNGVYLLVRSAKELNEKIQQI